MKFAKNTFFCALVLATGIFTDFPRCHGGDERDELVSALNALRSNLSTFQAHEFSFHEKSSAEGQGGFHQIIQTGSLKRANLFIGHSNQAEMIFAYDGTNFQNFSKEMSALSFSKSNRFPSVYGTIHPLLLLYCWIANPVSSTIEGLQSPSTWAELQDRIQWDSVAKPDVGELRFSVVDSEDSLRSYLVTIDNLDLPLPQRVEGLAAR